MSKKHFLAMSLFSLVLGPIGGLRAASPYVETFSAVPPPNGYEIVWHDEFEDLKLVEMSPSPLWSTYFRKWRVRHLAGNHDQGVKVADETSLVTGKSAGDTLRADGSWGDRSRYLHEVSNGTLKLRAYPLDQETRGRFWGFPYVASMIAADVNPGQTYGYWQIRARINAIGKGQHLAFWLLPDDATWPPEVDVFEVVGTNKTDFTANINPEKGVQKPPLLHYHEPPTADGFHTFGFEWTEDLCRWSIDGQVLREYTNILPTKPMYLLITWDIASKWPGQPDASTPWPAEVEIDYVRVYSKH